MSRKRSLPLVSGLVLSLLVLLFVALPVTAQEPVAKPTPDVYFIRLQPLPEDSADAVGGFQAAYERLEPTLRQLSSDGQIVAYEYLPEIYSVRLIASQEVMTQLASRPEVARVEPLHRLPIPTQTAPAPQDAAPPVTEAPPEAIPEPTAQVSEPVNPDAPPLVPTPVSDDGAASQPAARDLTYTISGVVRDHDGAPLKDVLVRTAYNDPMYATAWTDANGNYALTVNAGTYHISAEKYGLPGPPSQTITVPPNQTVNFIFPLRYTISGKVLDWDGTPIASASVSTKHDDPYRAFAQTDATGAYVLTVLAGTYHISAEKYGLPGPPSQTVTVPPNQTANFTFPQRYTISGKVLDWDGTPIVDASVSTDYDDPYRAFAQTDATGAYILTVLAGTYHVSVYKSGLPDLPKQTVTVPPNQVVNFTYPQRYTISGKVLDWDGTPIVDASVSTKYGDPVSAYARTDATGAYALTVLAGTYHVSVDKSGFPDLPEQTITVPPNQTVNFTFPQRYTISGKVLDWDGTPIVDASVSTKYGDPVSAYARTDATGAYALTVLAGTYHVSVDKSGYPDLPEQTITVPPNQTVNFTFPQRYTISGKVLDWDGTPIVDASVSTKYNDPVSANAQTDATGTYALTVLAGTYHVSVYKSGLFTLPEQTVTVPPNQVVNFAYPRRYTIRGTVRNYDNTPVKDVSVSTAWDDPVHASTQTDASGAYSLVVTAGTYSIGASKSGYPDPPDRIIAVPPDASGVDFIFPQPYPVRGTVRDADGKTGPGRDRLGRCELGHHRG